MDLSATYSAFRDPGDEMSESALLGRLRDRFAELMAREIERTVTNKILNRDDPREIPEFKPAPETFCHGCGHPLTAHRVDKKGRCEGCGCPSAFPGWAYEPTVFHHGVLRPGGFIPADSHDTMVYGWKIVGEPLIWPPVWR